MEAPKKLYLPPTAKGSVGASWLTFPLTNEDIEYIRKDAFVQKVEKFINNKFGDVVNLRVSETLTELTTRQDFIERFKKYMEE